MSHFSDAKDVDDEKERERGKESMAGEGNVERDRSAFSLREKLPTRA